MDAVDSWQDGQDDDEADDMLTGAMPSSLLQPQLPLDGENAGGAGSTANSRSVTPRGGEEQAPLLNLPELSAEADGGASLPPPSEPPDDRSSGGAPSVRRDWLLEGLSATATPRAGAAEHASASEETEAPEALRAQVRCLREEIRHMEAAAEREQRLREEAAERKERLVQEVLEREQSLREELALLLEERDGAAAGSSQSASPQRYTAGQLQAQQRQQAQQQRESEPYP